MSFKDIIGHKREIRALSSAVESGRVAHAYLFSGPDGVGKRLVAGAFAAALNCSSPEDAPPCMECADCSAVASSSHPNVMEVSPADKEGNPTPDGLIRIDRIRELQAALRFRVERGKKVAIVDGADRLMKEAANAFLKTLEEPPGASVIVLVTSRPNDLLPTILSRCQRISFSPLPEEEVRGFLVRGGMDPGDASFAARLSGGSISRALEAGEGGALTVRKEIVGKLLSVGRGDTAGQLRLAYELSRRDDLTEVLGSLNIWLRDLIVSREGAGGLMTSPEVAEEGARVPAGSRGLIDSYYMVERARYDITPPRYSNKLLTMETLLLGLASKGVLA